MYTRQLFLLPLLARLGASQSLADAIAGEPDLSALSAVLSQFPDIVSMLSSSENITILAPSNEGLAKIDPDADIPSVLSYHVLDGVYQSSDLKETKQFVPTLLENPAVTNVTGGQVVEVVVVDGGVKVNGDTDVVKADVTFSNGVLHIINNVLSIPPPIANALTSSDELSSLASALTSADLVGAVADLSDVTVFAPNNAAFEAIADVAAGLSEDQLKDVLTYHVVQGTVGYSSLLEDGMMLPTLQGGEVEVTIMDGSVMVNGAKVVMADILVANGVVHVIDSVLLPNETSTGTNGTDGGDDSEEDGGPVQAGAASVAPVAIMAGVAALVAAVAHL